MTISFPLSDSALLSNGGSLSAWGGGTVSGPGSGTAPSAASVPPGAGGGPPGSGTGTGPGGGNGAPPGGPGAVPTNAVPLGVSPDDMADKHHLLDVGGGIGGGNGGDSDVSRKGIMNAKMIFLLFYKSGLFVHMYLLIDM